MSTLSSSRALRATVQTIHISILSNNTAIYIYCLRSGATLVHLKLKFLTCHDCIVILYPNLPICIHNLMLWVLIYILVNLSSYVIAHFVVMSWTLLILYAYKFVKLNTLLFYCAPRCLSSFQVQKQMVDWIKCSCFSISFSLILTWHVDYWK
jgi:hypothetical protein